MCLGGGGGFGGGGGGSYLREDFKDVVKKADHDNHGVVIVKQLYYLGPGNSPEDTQDISEGDSESILSMTNKSYELDLLIQNGVKKSSEKI